MDNCDQLDNCNQLDNITIHSLDDCYYCEKAKDLLDGINKPYNVVKYNKNDEDYKQKVDALIEITNYSRFPQIFVNGDFIGGYRELDNLFKF